MKWIKATPEWQPETFEGFYFLTVKRYGRTYVTTAVYVNNRWHTALEIDGTPGRPWESDQEEDILAYIKIQEPKPVV